MTQSATYHRGSKNYGTGYEMMARIDAQDAKIKALVEALERAVHNVPEFYTIWHVDARAALAAAKETT